MSSSPAQDAVGQIILYLVVSLVIQTLFYGSYTVIMLLTTRMLMRRGLKSRVNMIMLITTLFMYILSAAYWAYWFMEVINEIQIHVETQQILPVSSPITRWLALFNALVLVNYVLSDAVVIWRARLICSPDQRKYMYFPLFCLIITCISVTGVIGLRIAFVAETVFSNSSSFIKIINTLQVSAWTMSLASNLSATGVVGVTAWRHRQTIRAAFDKTTKADQILRL
ncbi:hypothetical protein C8R44DRAFT_247952 [Mycena epipterygia]|nr:hypothetical protein C8R44DRAFT_247952 [Mycena epipterygia]